MRGILDFFKKRPWAIGVIAPVLVAAVVAVVTIVNSSETPPHTHEWAPDEAASVTAACTKEGTKAYKCSCGETRTETIAALGHDMKESAAAVAATCTADGATATQKCSRCDHTEGGELVTALGHDMKESAAAVAATCTADGVTAKQKCSRCEHTEGGEKIAAPGHDMQESAAAVAATCTADGVTAVQKCSRCDHSEGGEVIPAPGHEWAASEVLQPATDTQFGIHLLNCKHCGEKLKEIVPMTGTPALTGNEKALQDYLNQGNKLHIFANGVACMKPAGDLKLSKSEFVYIASFGTSTRYGDIGKLELDLNGHTLTVTNAKNEWISISKMLTVKNGTLKLGAVNHDISYQFWKYICPIYVPTEALELNLENANIEIEGDCGSFALVDDRDLYKGTVTVNAENSTLTIKDADGKVYTTADGTAFWTYRAQDSNWKG